MNPTSPQLDALLSRLSKVKRAAGGYVAECPAHEDSSPSLSLADGKTAVVLWCWAGCQPKDILGKLGLGWQDVFYQSRNGRASNGSAPATTPRKQGAQDRRGMFLEAEMAAERLQSEAEVLGRLRQSRGWAAPALHQLRVGWDGERLTIPVLDKANKPHDVLRYDPFGGGPRKMLAGEGRSRLPWPPPEGREASRGWPYVLVEGEGTAIAMASIGVNATALPGAVRRPTGDLRNPSSFKGPGWHPRWTQRFSAFRQVLLLPDCDESGHTLMRTVLYDMQRAGFSVVYLDLKLPRGEDVGDVLRVARTGELRSEVKGLLRTAYECARKRPGDVPAALEMIGNWRAFRS